MKIVDELRRLISALRPSTGILVPRGASVAQSSCPTLATVRCVLPDHTVDPGDDPLLFRAWLEKNRCGVVDRGIPRPS